MDEVTSKYQFLVRKNGFRVEGSNRVPVDVSLRETGFRVNVFGPRQLTLFKDIADDGSLILESTRPPETNLVQYQRLVDLVARGLMSQWQPPPSRKPNCRIRKWAIAQTRRALGGRIFEQWRRLVVQADRSVWHVQKAVFAAGRRTPSLLHEPLLYKDKYLARDIQQYRAAAALVPIAEDLCICIKQSESTSNTDQRMDDLDQPDVQNDDEFSCQPTEVLECLSNWQDICSPTGKKYGSLSRTLMQLPGGIPSSLLLNLRSLFLERPMTDRLELMTLLLAKGSADDDDPQSFPTKLFMHATRGQIQNAMRKLSNKIQTPLSYRRTRDVRTFVGYLLDFPERHHGGLSGLLRKSIRWHDAQGIGPAVDASDPRFIASTRTKKPPIPPPQMEGVRFLETVGDIMAEGELMGHCIASYVNRAVTGRCYLFHVERSGQCASVEVDDTGRVRQSSGPSNQSNPATAYGAKLLARWGKELRSIQANIQQGTSR